MATRSRDMSFQKILNQRPTLEELCKLVPISTKWYQMGIQLKLNVKKLNEIEEESKKSTNIPTIAKAAKAGKLKFIIGDGKNVVDFTYVDNVTHGHVLAGEHLHIESKVCGKAYNITNDELVKFADYITQVVTGLHYPPPSKHLPYKLILIN